VSEALPPPHLMIRVSGNADTGAYVQVGTRAAEHLMAAVNTWSARPVKEVLDWGCGPGRVAVHLAGIGVSLRGCDIDAEAIAWCNEHVAAGRFDVTSLYPPLPYDDQSFDAILACSVMTHLQRRVQLRWLKDLARVLRPGGVLAASVHGQAAAEGFGVARIPGIDDHYLNIGLADVVPDGYYRDVIQDEAYTREAWSQWLEVVAYEKAALELHDLVICRRSLEPA